MALPLAPPTPGASLFMQPKLDTHAFGIIGFEHPIDVEALKSAIGNSPVMHIPRMCSLVVLDNRTGAVKGWKRLEHLDLDRHFIIVPETLSIMDGESDESDVVNQYVADLSANCTLATDKPLWEIHVLVAHRCIVWWVHHALGDGVSFMSMLQGCFTETSYDHVEKNTSIQTERTGENVKEREDRKRDGALKRLWFDSKFVVQFLLKISLVPDMKTAIRGGAGVELRPKKLVTATFLIEDLKLVKLSVPSATINDVIFTVISSGIGRYLERRSHNGLSKGLHMTCVTLANVREKAGYLDVSDMTNENPVSLWGNKFGYLHLPVDCHKAAANPLEYLETAKVMLERKKRSVEARLSYKISNLIVSVLGAKFASRLGYRMLCNTTFLVSNLVGPREDMTMAGNPVTYLKINLSSTPHSLTMHVVTYKGKANLQILAAKDLIPDPEFLAGCFEIVLQEMKEAALAIKSTSQISRKTV